MSSFMKNFKVKNLDEGFLETSILDDMNKKWDDGFEYVYNKQQDCYFLKSKKDKYNITLENFGIDNIDVFKQMAHKNKLSFEEIVRLSYNSQIPINLNITSKSKAMLNDKVIQLNDAIILKDTQFDVKNGMLILTPNKMDETLYFIAQIENEQIQLSFKRIPVNDLNKVQYILNSSKLENKIYLKISFDLKFEKIKFNYNINTDNISSSEEYLKFMEAFIYILDNGLYLNDRLLKINVDIDKVNDQKKLIKLWKKIVDLEKFFDKKFIFRPNLSETEINDIYILHACFIEGIPVRENENLQYLTYELSENEEDNSLKQYKNNQFGLGIYGSFSTEILSVNFEFPCVKFYFDLLVNDIEKIENRKYKLIMDKNNTAYSCIMLFHTIDEQNKFLEDTDAINNLSNVSKEI